MKKNLHARVIWPKGSTPLSTVALRDKLKPFFLYSLKIEYYININNIEHEKVKVQSIFIQIL